ncbi:YeiH family protein [Paenibacillus spongiae]|uniref:Sulfate exporter family transporter n=1 Tax=Paenibacillus spongiae TaxID=2909671 RepID=A0ABY5S738_9BACL|nr:putative sulfate exporter family transporter [Paenibacillus spongiae]UVI29722.1 putative sulfate exporter family transporter [Paenibacillus spongiae]
MKWLQSSGPGLLFVFVLALFSTWLGSLMPIIGGPVFGIVLGVIINNTVGKPKCTQAGIQFCSKKVLQWSIIALGCGLSLTQVWQTGSESFSLMMVSLVASFLAAYGFGRLMNIPDRLKTLIGAGTGICGGSAIAAVSPIIEAEEIEIAYAISTIFLFNIAAVLLFPPLGHWLGMSDNAFGLLAGTAINDTSSVVAAGYLYSNEAGDYATIVKLTRTTMIIPISLLLAALMGVRKKRATAAGQTVHYSFAKIFPWFIIWFLAASLLNTLGLFGEQALHVLDILAKFMIVMALSAIGLSANFRKMMKSGIKPIILGLIVWFVVTAVSLIMLWVTGRI